MKFGKEFQQILDQSDFPDEWKSSAIEYRRLKKLIKDVVSELSSMGLSPDVLHRLLAAAEDEEASGASSPSDQGDKQLAASGQGRRASADAHLSVTSNEGADEVLEFEFESDESPPTFGQSSTWNALSRNGNSSGSASGSGAGRAYNRPRPDPLLDDDAPTVEDDVLSKSFDSVGASSFSSLSNPRNFRVRLLSDNQPRQDAHAGPSRSPPNLLQSQAQGQMSTHSRSSTAPVPIRPIGVADAIRSLHGDQDDLAGSLEAMSLGRQRTLSADGQSRHRRVVRRSMHEGGVRAQYVFAGNSNHPEPQLRFHLPAALSPSGSSRSHSPSLSTSATSEAYSYTTDDDLHSEADADADADADGDGDADDDDDDDDLQCLPIPQPTPRPNYSGLATCSATASTSPTTIKAGKKSPFLVPSINVSSPIIPASPTLQRMTLARSPIYALAAGSPGDEALKDLSLGDSAVDVSDDLDLDLDVDEGPVGNVDGQHSLPNPRLGSLTSGENMPIPEISTSSIDPAPRERDIIIPLASDRAFFDLLTAALTSLSGFHASQQQEFRESVDKLCRMISNSIVPSGSSVQVMPITPMPARGPVSTPSSILTPTSTSPSSAMVSPSRRTQQHQFTTHRPPPDILAHRITKMHKKDLYAWREIFTLWIEAEIFESSAERTRGERTVEQAEQRLQRFAGEVVKRGLGDRRTFRGKKTRDAWEEFLRLNVLLLDLKRFQLANINAARKILKKHDKRTALTASAGFQTFARTTLETVGTNGQVSTWTFYNTSLPHVLLASLTDVLLPILPSLDDYACLICTSIAFKPIRLSCQHLFCVRCLVKMQRAGQAECPLCRSPVVLLANKESLDTQVMGFMRDWFPREVKAKQRENDEEIADEIRAENGGESDGCVVM